MLVGCIMKNLIEYKKFENVDDIQYHKQVIKDVFQDIIDEYDMYEEETNNPFTERLSGFFYKIEHMFKTTKLGYHPLYVKFTKYNNGSVSYIGKLRLDISGHIKTLESMGYDVTDGSDVYQIYLRIDYTNS